MKNKYIKLTLIGLITVAFVSAIYLFTAQKYDYWPYSAPLVDSTQQVNTPTTDNTPVPTGSTVDKNTETASDGTGSDPSPEPVPSPDGGKSTVGIIISSANKTDSTLQVRVVIQNVTNTGECTLTLKKQGVETTRIYKAGIQAQSSTSTCKGFDVPLAELGSGAWSLTLVFENETVRGEAVRDVSI